VYGDGTQSIGKKVQVSSDARLCVYQGWLLASSSNAATNRLNVFQLSTRKTS